MNAKRTTPSITVEGMNEINQFSRKLITAILPDINNLIGKKIFLTDGSKSAKFQVSEFNYPDFHETSPESKHISYQYWFQSTYNGLSVYVKICINGGSYDDHRPGTTYCQYFNRQIQLGEVKDQILTSVKTYDQICESWGLDKTFTEDQIRADVNAYEAAKEEARRLYNAIPYEIADALHITR